MKYIVLLVVSCMAFMGPSVNGETTVTETPARRDARMAWWRQARFGMFVHWGLYSGLAGNWEGKPATGGGMEWIQHFVKADTDTYAAAALPKFQPRPGFARQWAQLAKEAGCRYLVFTTKHHEGFGLHASQYGDYNAGAKLNRDLVKEIVEACRAEGLKVGFYHSLIDWHHDQYDYPNAKGLPHPLAGRPSPNGPRDHAKYVDYLHAQVDELVSNYGPVDILWWDFSSKDFQGDQAWRASDLMKKVREKQPQIIMNNRLYSAHTVNAGQDEHKAFTAARGDFTTPEQRIPNTGMPGVDWETCMTLNTTWGYSEHDHAWKSDTQLIRNLVDIASKGGNYLLNVGPKGDGNLSPETIRSFRAIGAWMKVNSEAIYGTSAGLLPNLKWGRATRKDQNLYLFVFEWPKDGKLQVPLEDRVGQAHLLAAPSSLLKMTESPEGVVIHLPEAPLDPAATVIKVTMAAERVEELDLHSRVRPLPAANRFGEPNYFVWCGAPVKGPDGKYHLFYSRWPQEVGFAPGWAIHSEIAYAVSDKAQGPFKPVNVALPPRGINPATGKKYWDADVTHNSNAFYHDGKYYLYYMGNYGDGKYWTHRNHQRVGLAVAEKPEGPWKRFDEPIVDITNDKKSFDSLCVTNPAACLRPDGGVLLIYKAVEYVEGIEKGGRVRYGAAMADSPEGPYVKARGQIFELETPQDGHWMAAEDPFIWYSRKYGNRYYAVTTDILGGFTGQKKGLCLFESADGLNWKPASHPKVLNTKFRLEDGSVSTYHVERPALLIEDQEPLYLFGATDGYMTAGKISTNVQIPMVKAGQVPADAPAEGVTVETDPEGLSAVKETPEQRDARMAWWRQAKFGLFIHWGVYAVPAGKYGDKTHYGEWIMNSAKIPVAEYKSYAGQFNPIKYDPAFWVKTAKDAGMRYIVITSKHHDGFAMYPSDVTDWDIADATPYQKDLLGPLVSEAQAQGLKIGFYYSQSQDWIHPGGGKSGFKEGQGWDEAHKGDYDVYLKTIAVPQVREILTRYPIDILWWDTPMHMTRQRTTPLAELTKLRPGLITNNRLGTGYSGDTSTPEQFVPVTGYQGDWETCMTLNDHWGYNAYDHNWKSSTDLIRKLADICAKGGNFLLNVGPTAQGEFPAACVQRLQEVGQWLRVNGEAIYGTDRSPFPHLSWGVATRKGDRLYLHVFDWPKDGKLRVPLDNEAKSASLLATGQKLSVTKESGRLMIDIPAKAPDTADSVVVLDIEGDPVTAPLPSADAKASASAFMPGSEPANALDGTGHKRWRAPAEVKSAWLQVDLGKPAVICGYGFDEPDVWPRLKQRYTIEAQQAGQWKKIAEGKTSGHGAKEAITPVMASRFRFTIVNEGGSPGLAEVQLYRPE
jgi:alpha-L-fucosidase